VKLYFVNDPENNGYNEFTGKEEAEEFAKMCIDSYIEDEWDEDSVEQVAMGEVYSKAKKTNVSFRPPDDEIDEEGLDSDGSYWSEGWKYKCDYKMSHV